MTTGKNQGKKTTPFGRHFELILAVAVHSAALHRDGAKLLLPGLLNFGWVRKVFAEGGYAEPHV